MAGRPLASLARISVIAGKRTSYSSPGSRNRPISLQGLEGIRNSPQLNDSTIAEPLNFDPPESQHPVGRLDASLKESASGQFILRF